MGERSFRTAPGKLVGRLTGLAYALTHPDLQSRVKQITAESYAIGTEWLHSVTKEEDLPMSVHRLVPVIHALAEGLVIQRLLTRELVPDEVIRSAFVALAIKSRDPQ